MNIPFGNLKRQYDQLRPELDAAIQSVLDSGWFVLGNQVQTFEAHWADYCGGGYGVGVGSGTEALHLALWACGIQPGDEVITVANTCVPTIAALSSAGAQPIFVDIDPRTFTLDPDRIEERITPRTKAIVPVHLYGQCADMAPILAIAERHHLTVIEDCAQAHGAQYQGKWAGTMGQASAFSFYPSKNLGALGDGGLVLTADADIAARVTQLRNYGQERRYYHPMKGVNSRLDELQAAILQAKLPHLAGWNQRRRAIAQRYHQAFSKAGLCCPLELNGVHVYHLYVLRVNDRDCFQHYLGDRGVETFIHYPIPVHLQPAYQECRDQSRYLPITEQLASEIVSLPLYPELTDDEVDQVIATVLEAASHLPLAIQA